MHRKYHGRACNHSLCLPGRCTVLSFIQFLLLLSSVSLAKYGQLTVDGLLWVEGERICVLPASLMFFFYLV